MAVDCCHPEMSPRAVTPSEVEGRGARESRGGSKERQRVQVSTLLQQATAKGLASR